ncbi:MAG TPA: class I adenylate-forming enzyme family protein [Methylomirabilota bacterium]|nr:class I adenylate-forming enzyme family protein [Methylomirabilota bacterium]
MLYERWLAVARARRNDFALRDACTGREWSFGELLAEAESQPDPGPGVHQAEGFGARFILQVLRAWKFQRPLAPVEPGQRLQLPSMETPAWCAHLKATSGTTGRPRFVALTAEQLAADADNIVATMGLVLAAPNLAAISLAHSYGFSNLITPLLLHGIPLILAASPLPENIRAEAQRFDRVTLPAVPALWQVWADARAIPGNVHAAISAGAPLSLALEERVWNGFGLKLHNFYGSSECGGIAYDSSNTPRTDAQIIGAPLKGVQVSSTDEGLLEVRSAAVAEAYWPEPASELSRGVFRTADLGVAAADGIRLRGRASDLINVAGRKVSPEQVEEAILRTGQVQACLVFGAPARDGSEQIVAAITANPGMEIAELRRRLSLLIPNWQIPARFWLVDSLTANNRGKLSRREWRSRFERADADAATS